MAWFGVYASTLAKVVSTAVRRAVRSPVSMAVRPHGIDECHTDHCFNVAGIQTEGLFEKLARLRQVYGIRSPVQLAMPWKYRSIESGCGARAARRASTVTSSVPS